MRRRFQNGSKKYVIDFTGDKVRYCGKVLDRFSLALLVEAVNIGKGTPALDGSQSYDQMKRMLLDMLRIRGYENVTIAA